MQLRRNSVEDGDKIKVLQHLLASKGKVRKDGGIVLQWRVAMTPPQLLGTFEAVNCCATAALFWTSLIFSTMKGV